ncbi:cytochrome b/b6 domain protein [Sulfobacillus acidophilus TPY]|uniref:Cytochrome b/b6 domain protein n=1 Tax=Sulfobacillus acidophilus (strain ATCC 700253 / DSM 10332 / NAL) TaxID=679936 RepID=G8U183_SULAD|nr:cytochrome b/b6 domain protein [Sulfobacillus acidophilus TPY]AEW04316.1 Cytochrome b/b6 domain protein [Sulfobacillus acidophilus DSM 10332]
MSQMANWTEASKRHFSRVMSAETWLPSEMPEYAQGFMYMLGSLTASSFVVLIISGLILAANGPDTWSYNGAMRFVAATHFWAVQAFFFFMMLHLWRVFFTGAWRGGRGMTWLLGAIAFILAIPTAFTGFLINGDLYSQWNAVQAKDGLNALGLGWVNLTNAGQMFGMHVAVLPLLLTLVIGAHITRVRLLSVVPPYPDKNAGQKEGA